ncbi:hypothetical protein KM043_000482 [Ampulex compressa]|nr:hypothetical protein KM043_000482 [Ampulex compressa]
MCSRKCDSNSTLRLWGRATRLCRQISSTTYALHCCVECRRREGGCFLGLSENGASPPHLAFASTYGLSVLCRRYRLYALRDPLPELPMIDSAFPDAACEAAFERNFYEYLPCLDRAIEIRRED